MIKTNFIKAILVLTGLLLSGISMPKVAYIPLFDNNLTNGPDSHILVVDLEKGSSLKRIYVGEGVGPIFINDSEDAVFAAASRDFKIIQIDTKSLEVSREWSSLPVEPQQVILNTTGSKLYFSERNQDSIYQIDLASNNITVAINIAGFQEFYYSENMEFIVFRSYDKVADEYELHTYDLNNLSLIHQTATADSQPMLIDNDGENYYYSVFGYGRFQSRSLVDNQLNWSFYQSSGIPLPIGELPENFSSATFINSEEILVTGWRGGSYIVNVDSGKGQKINDLTFNYGDYANIDGSRFLKSNKPEQVVCPPISPVPCSGYYPLHLVIQNHDNASEQIVYQRDESGNLAKGRYIGDGLYSIPTVPSLSFWAITIIFICILFLTYIGKKSVLLEQKHDL